MSCAILSGHENFDTAEHAIQTYLTRLRHRQEAHLAACIFPELLPMTAQYTEPQSLAQLAVSSRGIGQV